MGMLIYEHLIYKIIVCIYLLNLWFESQIFHPFHTEFIKAPCVYIFDLSFASAYHFYPSHQLPNLESSRLFSCNYKPLTEPLFQACIRLLLHNQEISGYLWAGESMAFMV